MKERRVAFTSSFILPPSSLLSRPAIFPPARAGRQAPPLAEVARERVGPPSSREPALAPDYVEQRRQRDERDHRQRVRPGPLEEGVADGRPLLELVEAVLERDVQE